MDKLLLLFWPWAAQRAGNSIVSDAATDSTDGGSADRDGGGGPVDHDFSCGREVAAIACGSDVHCLETSPSMFAEGRRRSEAMAMTVFRKS